MRRVLIGMGNPLGLDDAVGLHVAEQLAGSDWTCWTAGTALENVIGAVKRLEPDLVVVVDAADMGLAPGSFRRLPLPSIPVMLGTTHGLPLTLLVPLLQEAVEELVVVGVQPGKLGTGEGLSAEAAGAVRYLVRLLTNFDLAAIPGLD